MPPRIRPSISHLLTTCSPAHIAGFVVPVVVDAVNRVLQRWARADVREEGAEIGPPLWVDGDATCPVVPVFGAGRVVTPLIDALPAHVLWRDVVFSRPAVRESGWMRFDSGGRRFTMQAAATSGRRDGAQQTAHLHGALGAAVAPTHPQGDVFLKLSMKDRPASEPHTGEVASSRHMHILQRSDLAKYQAYLNALGSQQVMN